MRRGSVFFSRSVPDTSRNFLLESCVSCDRCAGPRFEYLNESDGMFKCWGFLCTAKLEASRWHQIVCLMLLQHYGYHVNFLQTPFKHL